MAQSRFTVVMVGSFRLLLHEVLGDAAGDVFDFVVAQDAGGGCVAGRGRGGGAARDAARPERGGLAHGDGGDADDVVGLAAAREVVDGARQALEDRAEGGRAGEAFDEFVGDVARLEVGEDEDVGGAAEGAVLRLLRGDGRHEGGVGLEFAVELQAGLGRGGALLGDARGLGHLVHQLVLGAAARGEAQQGDARLGAEEGLVGLRGRQRDVRQLLGRGAGVHAAVGEEEGAVARRGRGLELHQEAAARGLDALGRPDAVEGAAEHVGGGRDGAGDHAVGEAEFDHHGADVEAVPELGGGLLGGHALGLAALVEGRDELGQEGGGGGVDDLESGGRHAGFGAGLGGFGGGGEDLHAGDAEADDFGGGFHDARVHAFGEDHASVVLFGFFDEVFHGARMVVPRGAARKRE